MRETKGVHLGAAIVASLLMWDGILALIGVSGVSWAWTAVQWSPAVIGPALLLYLSGYVLR